MVHVYNIAAWNENGLTQRITEVEAFLNTQKTDFLLVLCETHFTERNYVKIPTYTTCSTNRPDGTAHAGSGIIVRRDMKYHKLAKYEMDHTQATNISIEGWDGDLTTSAIDCPPRHSIKKEQFNAFINSLGHRFLAGGDFNAKHQYWGSSLINPKGREIYQPVQKSNEKYYPRTNRIIGQETETTLQIY
jgi:exonuclease III